MMHAFNRFMNTQFASAHTAEASCACANSASSNIALILDTMIMVSIIAILGILGLLILGEVNTHKQHIPA